MPPQNNNNFGVTLVGVFVTLGGLALCWLLWKTNCCGHVKLRNNPPKKPPPSEAQPSSKRTRRDDTESRNTNIRNESQTQRPSMIVAVELGGTFNYLGSADIERVPRNTELDKERQTRGVLTHTEWIPSKFNEDPYRSNDQTTSFLEGESSCSSARQTSQHGSSTFRKEPLHPSLSQHEPASASNIAPSTSKGHFSNRELTLVTTDSARAKLRIQQPTKQDSQEQKPTIAKATNESVLDNRACLATFTSDSFSYGVEKDTASNSRAPSSSSNHPSLAQNGQYLGDIPREEGFDGKPDAEDTTGEGTGEDDASKEIISENRGAEGDAGGDKTTECLNKYSEDKGILQNGGCGDAVGPQGTGERMTSSQVRPPKDSRGDDTEDLTGKAVAEGGFEDTKPKEEVPEERIQEAQKPGVEEVDEEKAAEISKEDEEKKMSAEEGDLREGQFEERPVDSDHTIATEVPEERGKLVHENKEDSPPKEDGEEWERKNEAPESGATDNDGDNPWAGGNECSNDNEWNTVKEDAEANTNTGWGDPEPSPNEASAEQPKAEGNPPRQEAPTEATLTKKTNIKNSPTKHRSRNGVAKEQARTRSPLGDASSVGNKQQTTGKKGSPKKGRASAPSKASSSRDLGIEAQASRNDDW
ncbi:hypothetical protein QBC40DRAFT_251063 [Triangularia verruculosa]|uniref:Uncharacterized protein n=1 Tax=Triangularia verruculosa TaxID=2587418 RepID=A0AAN6XMD3_9PEZI|nr:hypothetical protein QBC40DRAFT_251063 [Triangularia verruculosa]